MLAFFGVLSSKQSLDNPEPLSKDPNPNIGLPVLADPPVAAKVEEEAKANVVPAASSKSIKPNTMDPPSEGTKDESAEAETDEVAVEQVWHPERPKSLIQRISFRTVVLFYGNKATRITHGQEKKEEEKAAVARKRALFKKQGARSSAKRVHASALDVQKVIIGPSAILPNNGALKSRPVSSNRLAKIRTELVQPNSANKLIAELRQLPLPNPAAQTSESNSNINEKPKPFLFKSGGPIHAVCLQDMDEEVEKQFFSKLKSADGIVIQQIPSVASASVESLINVLDDLHVVNLMTAPDFGLGQPGDGDGILAGSVPTPKTVSEGISKITPELMALGYATTQALFPDHKGIYPPTDRISVITYWWGLEVVLPPPTMKYLSAADSISHALVNLLTALSLMSGGIREILPFVRYISQFLDFEWSAIKAQDKGKGVVCAATWIMPAALIPRPWDFPDPPSKTAKLLRDGARVVEDIITPTPMLPKLVVTPPSVIKPNDSPKK